MEEPPGHEPATTERPTLRDWLFALARLRVLWPLPALLFLAVTLPFASDEVWHATLRARRQWSLAELSLVTSVLGSLLYWLTMYLSHVGLLHPSRSSWLAREPSDTEIAIASTLTHVLCLLMAYGGPVLLLFAPAR